ncbi:hypothetical protein [uncultured Brevundimonas sp.]|uniref:hypothetical protein n=1 Tax=uncultured Brevundimonas sp. TaxID=213418 RepID=UPI0030EE718C|tara:strand:+ start:3458 stop:3826 length:369 start_codon:yes stop_codon:yes gene_type:complete
MIEDEAGEIIANIRREIETATDTVLCSVEESLDKFPAARAGDVESLARIEQLMFTILEACAFQDLTGQRLTKLRDLLSAHPLQAVAADPLLNGPALAGEGVGQAAADSLMDSVDSWQSDPNS